MWANTMPQTKKKDREKKEKDGIKQWVDEKYLGNTGMLFIL